ncbi:hypothetical protein EVAR_16691_1 [Eumeta japonica]|uniref:Uncharacterized protein n=1 Tax=Eumeta variegata TaxID=151549 RepID=A0A4C1V630_EUMVA|nr:hypothetical protein EVAR_16691_1 [Eumeta japonica]
MWRPLNGGASRRFYGTVMTPVRRLPDEDARSRLQCEGKIFILHVYTIKFLHFSYKICTPYGMDAPLRSVVIVTATGAPPGGSGVTQTECEPELTYN